MKQANSLRIRHRHGQKLSLQLYGTLKVAGSFSAFCLAQICCNAIQLTAQPADKATEKSFACSVIHSACSNRAGRADAFGGLISPVQVQAFSHGQHRNAVGVLLALRRFMHELLKCLGRRRQRRLQAF